MTIVPAPDHLTITVARAGPERGDLPIAWRHVFKRLLRGYGLKVVDFTLGKIDRSRAALPAPAAAPVKRGRRKPTVGPSNAVSLASGPQEKE